MKIITKVTTNNVPALIEEMKREIEEYGDLHGEGCMCMMEDPDECDCEEMKAIKQFTETWMQKVNMHWIEMATAHLPHCKSPESKKMITRMKGLKNR